MSTTLSEQSAQSIVAPADEVATTAQILTLQRLWIVFILATGGLIMGMNQADPDLWGHSLYGRDWIETGRLAKTTTGSFTSIGFRWINHENLAELLTAWTEMRFGQIGLTVGKFLLSQVVLGLVLFQARRHRVGWGIAGFSVVVASIGLGYHWHFRPQILGYTMFSGMLVALSWIFEGWEGRWNLRHWKALSLFTHEGVEYHWKRMRCLWLSFGLFAVWANTHGSFAAGLAVFVAYLVFRTIEALSLYGREAEGRLRRFVLMIGVAVLGTGLTPYGLDLHVWMLKSIGHAQPEICDWQPLTLLDSMAFPFWTVVAVAAFSLRFSRLPKDFTHLMILGLVGWQAVSHVRHVTFLALLVAFWIPPHLQSAWQQITADSGKTSDTPLYQSTVQWACLILLVGVIFMGNRLVPQLCRIEVNTAEYPVAAMQFMEDWKLRGRTVTKFGWAQYELACFAQEPDPLRRSTIAFDGRFTTCYSPEVVDIYFDFDFGKQYTGKRYRSPNSGPIDPEKALRNASPELFVLCRKFKESVQILEAHRDEWTLLYQDSLAQIWGLKARFDTPGTADYVPPEARQIGDALQAGKVPYPALPVVRESHESLAVR